MKKEDAQIIADAIGHAFNTPRSIHEMAYLEALAVALAGDGFSNPVGREISNVAEALDNLQMAAKDIAVSLESISSSLNYMGDAMHRIAEVLEAKA